MKKVLSLVAAGAMLFSVASATFAHSNSSTVKQNAVTVSVTGVVNATGGNTQSGNGKQVLFTGGNTSTVQSVTVGNVSTGKGNVTQNSLTGSLTVVGNVSGGNNQTQTGNSHHSSSTQVLGTGGNTSTVGSVTVSNVSIGNI